MIENIGESSLLSLVRKHSQIQSVLNSLALMIAYLLMIDPLDLWILDA